MKLSIIIFIYINVLFGFSQNINHQQWTSLLKKHVSPNGAVDYKAFQKDHKALNDYINFLSLNAPSKLWSKIEILAYWINAYNALTIQLIIEVYPLKSIKNIWRPWSKKLIVVEGKKLSLDTIEHEILRKMNEPRIHFAIVCASKSCPKLQNSAFEASNLDLVLENATKEFINDQEKNSISKKVVKLSKIFKWFAADFPKNKAFIKFLNRYSTTKIDLDAKINFLNYDWSLNE